MSTPRTPRLHAGPLALGAAVVVALLVLLGGAPAGAHGGEGDIEVTSTTREGDDVTVAVRVFYVGDGHGVPDATVTLVAGDGTPVPMTAGAEEGIYSGTVAAAPGEVIRVTSVEPSVTVEATAPEEVVPPSEATASTDASSTEIEAGDTTAPETTAAPDATGGAGEDDTAAAPVPTSSTGGDDDDGGSSTGLILGLVALVVVVGGVAAFVVLRKPSADAEA